MQFRISSAARCIRNLRVFGQWRHFCTKNENTAASFHLLGSGACGDPSSFYLQARNTRYIFNCGENIARLAQANGIHLSTVENVFFTQTKWRQIGGLGSLLKIIWEQKKSQIVLHGTQPLKTATIRIMASMNFPTDWDVCEFNEMATYKYEDPAIRIDFIPLQSNDSQNNASTATAYYCELKSIRRLIFQGFLASSRFEQHLVGVKEESIISKNFSEARGFRFLVIDVPSIDFVDKLDFVLQNMERFRDQNSLDLIIHFSPQRIIELPEYERFIEQTKASSHFKLNESNRFSNLRAPYEMQSKLNELDSNIFPLLRSEMGSVLPNIYDERGKTYPKIVFLGTGSKYSKGSRNVTSILVHTSQNSCILLDCGEGACGQISRFYGTQSVEIFRKIKAVFISHMHADHYHGLLRLMELRKELMPKDREPLKLMSPKRDMKSWLFFFDNHVDAIHDDLMFIENHNLINGCGLSSYITKQINVRELKTCLVPHTETSYAIALTMNSTLDRHKPFKLTFSGDTLPCDELVRLGNGSTLLIHESTFPDCMRADDKLHCTMSQAIEQGRKMNAKFNILTHFGQRHLIPWPEPERELDANVGIAFDNMELIESDLCKLNAIYSKLKLVFPKEFIKYQKRVQKIKNENEN